MVMGATSDWDERNGPRRAATASRVSSRRNGGAVDLVVWGQDFTLIIENKVDCREYDRS